MRTSGGIFLIAVILLVLPAGTALAQSTDGTVTVLHGIPGDGGIPVDIYVNGDYSAPFIAGLTLRSSPVRSPCRRPTTRSRSIRPAPIPMTPTRLSGHCR